MQQPWDHPVVRTTLLNQSAPTVPNNKEISKIHGSSDTQTASLKSSIQSTPANTPTYQKVIPTPRLLQKLPNRPSTAEIHPQKPLPAHAGPTPQYVSVFAGVGCIDDLKLAVWVSLKPEILLISLLFGAVAAG